MYLNLDFKNESIPSGNPAFRAVSPTQGDPIMQIFKNWAIGFFGQLFENYRSRHIFSHGNSNVLILTKKHFWLQFGRFLRDHLVALIPRSPFRCE
jgi:hypothetical protein